MWICRLGIAHVAHVICTKISKWSNISLVNGRHCCHLLWFHIIYALPYRKSYNNALCHNVRQMQLRCSIRSLQYSLILFCEARMNGKCLNRVGSMTSKALILESFADFTCFSCHYWIIGLITDKFKGITVKLTISEYL